MSVIDPFDVLATHLRELDVPDPALDATGLVDQIVAGTIEPIDISGLTGIAGLSAASAERARRRRRRRRMFGTGLGVVALAGGVSLAAATILRQDVVTQPQAGVLCRIALDLDAGAHQTSMQADPAAACRRLWADGTITVPDRDEGEVPDLVACIGPRGVVEVFPVEDGQSCESVDLAPLGTAVPAEDPLVALQDRLIVEVNQRCISYDDAAPVVEAALSDLGFEGWTIVFSPQRPDEPCTRAAVEPIARQIQLFRALPPPTTVGTSGG